MSPTSTTAWLYPGQGSQEIGMGRSLLAMDPRANEVFALAEEYSGLPLRNVSQKGPESTLVRTDHLQPTIVALSVALTDYLKSHGHRPAVVAGHSLGELSALYAAGVLDIHDVLKLAVARGQLMAQSACGGMLAVKDVAIDRIERLIEECQEGVLVAANFNAPTQLVVSGDDLALDALVSRLAGEGGSCVRLNVQGAWHSPLVAAAATAFQEHVDQVTFHSPKCKFLMGATAQEVADPEAIRELLKAQICSPVRWYDLIHKIESMGIHQYWEVGPGKVLKGLMRKILADANSYTFVGADNARFLKEVVSSGVRP